MHCFPCCEPDPTPEPEIPEEDEIAFLLDELADLTETLLPHECDKIGHIRQRLEASRRGKASK